MFNKFISFLLGGVYTFTVEQVVITWEKKGVFEELLFCFNDKSSFGEQVNFLREKGGYFWELFCFNDSSKYILL